MSIFRPRELSAARRIVENVTLGRPMDDRDSFDVAHVLLREGAPSDHTASLCTYCGTADHWRPDCPKIAEEWVALPGTK